MQAPPDFGREPLLAVHSADYLDYLEHAYARWQAEGARRGSRPGSAAQPVALPERPRRGGRPPCPSPSIVAQTGYYLSDLSCPIGPHTWRSALRSTHSAVAATDHVAAHGGAAYALCRPSGHHAHRDRAGGFCYLNSSAAPQPGCGTHARVAVLDVDAHHGDGTQQIFYRRADVMTASLHADPAGYYPFYSGYAHERGHGEGEGFNLNLPLPHGSGNDPFLRALDTALAALAGHAPQALVLALGFDTTRTIPSACCAWTSMRTATSARASAPWDCPPWWCRKAATWSRPSGRRWTPSCKAWAGAERRDASSRPLRGPVLAGHAAASRRAGVLLFFAALVAFATFDAGAKRLLEHYPAPFLNVVRYVAVATLALFLLWRAGRPRLRDAPQGCWCCAA